jgi:hypothetical protein
VESIVVTPPLHLPNWSPVPSPNADLLRELIEVQREQLSVLRSQQAATDERARWRGMHARHADDFPHLPGECRTVLPLVEKAYLSAVAQLTAELADPDADMAEFQVTEMLDRHVPKLGQLWSVLTQVSQLAAVAPVEPR